MTYTKDLTLEDFDGLEGEVFTVVAEELGVQLEATLAEAKATGTALREGGGFCLLFQGPETPGLNQATYQVSHARIGTQYMFLVPVTKTDAGYQYEAVFT